MNLESNTPEKRLSHEEIAFAASELLNSQQIEAVFWEEAEEIAEESNFAKAQTWLINFEDEPESDLAELPGINQTPKYVQGVVQKEQVYLITNLLAARSQTLIQSQRVWTIGRNRAAALPLQDRKMSRRHSVIMYTPQNFYLLDLNSMNGSYVNGIRVKQRQVLEDGDRICLGNTEFWFYVSRQARTLDLIHPEVLSRLNYLESRKMPFTNIE